MKKRKIFSVLLVLMILFLNVPADAFSFASEKCESLSDLEKQVNIESDDEIFILEEDTSKRGQFEKHFLCSDGSYIAVTYTESVHYLSNDNYWEDIDLTPEYNTATGKYVKNNGSFGYSFRENASSDDMVEIRTGGHAISWGLEIANNNESKECDIASVTGQAPADNNRILTVSNAKAEIIKENNSSYYTCKKYITDSKSFQLSNSSAKIKYGNYTEDDSISLEYTVYHDKIEEDIIIDKKGSADTFSMNMNIGNLMPEVNPDGSVVLTDESGEVICRIGIPYMMDSAFAVCNDISVKAEENGTNCKITYIPNKEWMNSSERVYPIILDPSVTTSDYVSNIEDTYVEENSSVNHSTEQYLYINRNGNNKRNAIIRINQLPIVDEAMPIISAYLVMTAQSESPDFIDMKAAYLDTGLDIEDYNYGLSQRTYNSFVEYSCFEDGYSNVEFDVSSHIYEMYDDAAWDEENGYDYHGDFVIGLEYSTDTFYVPPFYSSEFTGTASRPKLLIRYGYSLPAGILNNNVYSFMNCGSACYMSVNGTNPANNSNIYQLLGVGNGAQLSQKFKLEYVPSTGGYLLRSMTSSSGTDKVVSINRGTSSIDSNMNIRLSTPNDPIGQEWLVVPIDYYEFKIVPRANMSLAITAYGSSNGSNTGTSYNSAGNIFVKEYDSDNNNQRWYIDDAGGEEIYTGVLRSSVETGTYYVSNSYSGKYLHRNTNNVNCARDKIAVLGENTVQWKIVNLGDGYCTIQRSDLPEFYIAQDGDGVKVVFRSSESIDEKCKWNIRFLSGAYLIMNKNGKYLTYNSSNSTVSLSNLSSAGTNSYKMQQWRIVEEEDYVELGYGVAFSDFSLDIGESKTAIVNKSPSNASWSNYNDFEYSIVSGNQYVSFNNTTGKFTRIDDGISKIKATHKTTGISIFFYTYDCYQHELIYSFGFSFEEASLIHSVYDKIDSVFPNDSDKEHAWKCARLLSEFCYDDLMALNFNYWDDVAGSVTDEEDIEDYFINTLGYTSQEYDAIKDAICHNQCQANQNHQINDFAHLQYSLAARLAYSLDFDEGCSNLGVQLYTGNWGIYSDEEVSYFGGWLGDALLGSFYASGTNSLNNDDYMADLDAENIYRIIDQGGTSINAISAYYAQLSNQCTRADIFLQHIPYETVEGIVFYELIDANLYRFIESAEQDEDDLLKFYYEGLLLDENYHWNVIRSSRPDTYDFLKSLYHHQANLVDYQ